MDKFRASSSCTCMPEHGVHSADVNVLRRRRRKQEKEEDDEEDQGPPTTRACAAARASVGLPRTQSQAAGARPAATGSSTPRFEAPARGEALVLIPRPAARSQEEGTEEEEEVTQVRAGQGPDMDRAAAGPPGPPAPLSRPGNAVRQKEAATVKSERQQRSGAAGGCDATRCEG
ncbi:unnamed protein product [Prorocentrum cordatum]|uniref:Uncharacterized protein n=1 Tax=Prorocentrum cordatum TaxID=2364126 RepID=A0ABN9Y6Q6_9DINO|nr:unnamed protein product [Polarella glacialis]